MKALDYMEMILLQKRLRLLRSEWESLSEDIQNDYPESEFVLKEVANISALIETLETVKRVYAGK